MCREKEKPTVGCVSSDFIQGFVAGGGDEGALVRKRSFFGWEEPLALPFNAMNGYWMILDARLNVDKYLRGCRPMSFRVCFCTLLVLWHLLAKRCQKE